MTSTAKNQESNSCELGFNTKDIMTSTAKNQGKPENRKRKMADADEEKKNKRPNKSRSESNVAEDFLIANYARLGLNDRRGKPELPNADEELEEEEDAEMKTVTNHSKSDEKDEREEEEEAMTHKRKTYNKEGPAAKKLKKPEGMRGKSKFLFVKDLSFDTDEYTLMAAFDGAVSARIPTFQHTGKSKGFGFVDFSSAEAAADAFDSMNGQSIDGRRVTLEFGIGKGPGDSAYFQRRWQLRLLLKMRLQRRGRWHRRWHGTRWVWVWSRW